MITEALAIISALAQVGTGIWQGIKADEASKETRPTYEVPDEVKQLLGIAQQQAYGDMPGYNLAKSNIEQQAATGFSRATDVAESGSDILGYVAAQGVGQNRAMNELAAANAQYQATGQDKLKAALQLMAGYKDQQFEYNQAMPYSESQAAASVMKEGAIQNIVGGLQGGISNYMSYDLYSQMLGLNKSEQETSYDNAINTILGNIAKSQSKYDPGFVGNPGGSDFITLPQNTLNPYSTW